MSLMVVAAYEPDPYMACHTGVFWHPRYHDCENCEHAKNSFCDFAKDKENLKLLEEAIADGEAMLASYPKLNPNRLP